MLILARMGHAPAPHTAARPWDAHDSSARLMVPAPHPPAHGGRPVGMGGSTTAPGGLADRGA